MAEQLAPVHPAAAVLCVDGVDRGHACTAMCSSSPVCVGAIDERICLVEGHVCEGVVPVQLLNAWIGWDRLRYAPPQESVDKDPVRWGLPESQVKQLLFEGKDSMLEVLANLLHTSEARAGFR